METHILFFVAAVLAAAINSLAGGGGLITFPLLALVVSPVVADATSALALLPAYPTAVWRTRGELSAVPRRWVWLLLIPSVLGGLAGALLLVWTGDRKEAHESDIVLTLTPHIVRVLDLSEADLRPFRLGRDAGAAPTVDLPSALPRDRAPDALDPADPPAPTFPQPRQPGQPPPADPLKGTLPGTPTPILPPAPPPPTTKKGGGGL